MMWHLLKAPKEKLADTSAIKGVQVGHVDLLVANASDEAAKQGGLSISEPLRGYRLSLQL